MTFHPSYPQYAAETLRPRAAADDSTSPLAAEHRDTERVLPGAGVPFTLLRNGYYTEVYTDPLGRYLKDGQILGASADGKLSAATRQDYATASAAALLQAEGENRTYELGGPAFGVPELARVISEVTGTKVTYHDLPPEQYARAGLDQATACFVAALDTSIARGDLQTSSQDLAHLLDRPATPLAEVVRAGNDLLKVKSDRDERVLRRRHDRRHRCQAGDRCPLPRRAQQQPRTGNAQRPGRAARPARPRSDPGRSGRNRRHRRGSGPGQGLPADAG